MRLRRLVWPGVMSLLIVYLSFHAVRGDRGLMAWGELADVKTERQQMLTNLQHANQQLYRNIQLLSGPVPDPDFLDERVRDVLGFTQSGDVVVLLPTPESRSR